jgi:predicted acylesterase/phospholipase RssA
MLSVEDRRAFKRMNFTRNILTWLAITSFITNGHATDVNDGSHACRTQTAPQLSTHRTDADYSSLITRLKGALIPSHTQNPLMPVRTLSLDGGGLRGLIFLPQLRAIEILTGMRIHELFDLVGGTSTGGIAAICMSYCGGGGQVMPLKDVMKVYLSCSREIFPAPYTGTATIGLVAYNYMYSSTGLERIIKSMVGDKTFSPDNFVVPVLITSVDENRDATKIFCSQDPDDARHCIWQVARATSAAKTYFPDIELGGTIYVDGGHKENHPAKVFSSYYGERLTPFFSGADGLANNKLAIMSFGTGNIKQEKHSLQIFQEWVLSKISSTIQNQYSKQEEDADVDLRREAELCQTLSLNEDNLLARIPELAEKRKRLPENQARLKEINAKLQDIKIELAALHLFFRDPENLKQLNSGMANGNSTLTESYENWENLMQLKTELEKEKTSLIADVTGPLGDSKEKLQVQAYHRCQTDPLPVELHEMDQVGRAPDLFAKGLEMLRSASFKALLKGIFGASFRIESPELDRALARIADIIKAEVALLDIYDTKPVTLIALINDCFNQFSNKPMPENYFGDLLSVAGIPNLEHLDDVGQLAQLLKWSNALLLENETHWRIYGSVWRGMHGVIHTKITAIKEGCLKRVASQMQKLNPACLSVRFDSSWHIAELVDSAMGVLANSWKSSKSADVKVHEKAAKDILERNILAAVGIDNAPHQSMNQYIPLAMLLMQEIESQVRLKASADKTNNCFQTFTKLIPQQLLVMKKMLDLLNK